MTCSSMVVIRLIAVTICLSTCAQLGHSLLEELERDDTSNTASTECDGNWVSGRNTNGCEEYGDKKYCKKGGDHYGEDWNHESWGKFEDWADDQGRTALVCPQCGCILAKFVQLSSTQLSDEEGLTIKFKASSSWPSSRNSYNSSKAVKGGRSYWCSKKTDPAPYWWISFEAKPIEVVSIAFEEKYPGAVFEFFASSGEKCAEDGTVLINGSQTEISNKNFENGGRYHCYGLRITKLVQQDRYGALATLRKFQLTINHKDDCNEQSCSGNGKCIDGVIKKSACVCSAGFTGKDCGAESGPGSFHTWPSSYPSYLNLKMKITASSYIWNHAPEKALKGPGESWQSTETEWTVIKRSHWWISFEEMSVKIVEIWFHTPDFGATYELRGITDKNCHGIIPKAGFLIRGKRDQIRGKRFYNWRSWPCYVLSITPSKYRKSYLQEFRFSVQDKNNCKGQLCNGKGTCTDGFGQYTCNCIAGYQGKDCEDKDDCEGQSCNDNGQCIDRYMDYTCKCNTGFIGKNCEGDLSECPPTTSRHYKEYVDKSGYLCYKGFAVGCESINQTARACKSTYSKKMDTDTYFWMPEYWRSKEKYHICSSHVECLNYMKAEDKRFTGDFLPCPPNNIGPRWNSNFVQFCRYGHYYGCSGSRRCWVTAKISEHEEHPFYVKTKDGNDPYCLYDSDCDLRKLDRKNILYPVIEDDPQRWG